MTRPPCYCDLYPFPHRFVGDCDYYVSRDDADYVATEEDRDAAQELALDNRDRAIDINAESRNPWK